MKEAYCSYEVAKLLKENGFDIFNTYGWDEQLFDKEHPRNFSISFDNKEHWISCPTHQMACAWLRDIHDIDIEIRRNQNNRMYRCLVYKNTLVKCITDTIIETYEEAVEAALKYALENLIE